MEVAHEAEHVPHHRTKLVFLFSAMRHFAQELREMGWTVDYIELTDPDNTCDFTGEVMRALNRHDIDLICLSRVGDRQKLAGGFGRARLNHL
jgi:deoxyribodipyrimidine photolyase-related protein